MTNDPGSARRGRSRSASVAARPAASKPKRPSPQWRRMDLHIHTPGSNDYQEPHISYLDILRQASARGLDIIAITDHNTVAGYAAMQKEVEQLLWLEGRGRIDPLEQRQLDEYRRVLDKLLVLPGFEFTATFGFHILGIFPPETPVSYLEHLLLTLRVPPALLREGSSTVGATSDVLTAYHVINEAGGLVIAAHVNSGNGVMMRGLDFGGQTRVAYTQDPNVHALEVTDLEKRGNQTTRRFFDGSKPEYPRPMRCIQGSDAHRLVRESATSPYLGVGERITEILLEDLSFDALAGVIRGNDHSLTRPYRGTAKAVDFVQVAREEGESLVQAFHPSINQRGGHLDAILRDIGAMANTNGGTLYIGVPTDPKAKPEGVRETPRGIEALRNAIAKRFSPEPPVQIDSLPTQGTTVVRVTVTPGPDAPYALDSNLFYVRDETETTLAVRDEIVRLVERGLERRAGQPAAQAAEPPRAAPPPAPRDDTRRRTQRAATPAEKPPPSGQPPANGRGQLERPRTGVEIVESQERDGTVYHTLRDLRSGNLINNVTRSSARRLWHYAITQAETAPPNFSGVQWRGNVAVLNRRPKGNSALYDLIVRDDDGIHVYYGVTDSGLSEEWLALVEEPRRE
ncbi:MAG: putative DNA binding domain-containing protein [Candidatus Promineofilum sp.]|nr:putative DNA binding domain-containing protein [Promineifilum sp.]